MNQQSPSSRSQPAGPAGTFPWLAPETDGRRLLPVAALLAAAVHLSLFAVTWPRPMRTGASRDSPDQLHVLRLQNVRFELPRPREGIQRPPTRVPVPDLTPEGPEIVERSAREEEIHVDWDAWTVPGSMINVPPPPAVGAETPRIVDVGEIEAPQVLERVQPVYTRAAIAARLEGAVIVELVIGEDGRVESVRVLRGLPLGLIRSAVEAVRRWRFEPSTLDGRPIKVRFRLTVHFQLR